MNFDIHGAITAISPIIEASFGPLPRFRTIRHHPRWHCDFPWQPICAYGANFYHDSIPRLVFCEETIARLLNDNQFTDKPEAGAYLMYAFVHDTIHMYQLAHPIAGFRKDLSHWEEGSAEAATLQLLLGDSHSAPQLASIGSKYLHVDISTRNIRKHAVRHVTRKLVTLTNRGLIYEPTISQLLIPFTITPQYVLLADLGAKRLLEHRIFDEQNALPYTLGCYRHWRIATVTGIGMDSILRTPITNRQLLRLARTLGEKRPSQ